MWVWVWLPHSLLLLAAAELNDEFLKMTLSAVPNGAGVLWWAAPPYALPLGLCGCAERVAGAN